MDELSRFIESIRGITGSGDVLEEAVRRGWKDYLRTMEPGDILRTDPSPPRAAPIGHDLWYIWCNDNFMRHYYGEIDGDHYKYEPYMAENLSFLSKLTGVKPIKTLRDLEQHLVGAPKEGFGFWEMRFDFTNNGIYWINTLAWELHRKEVGIDYASDGPKGFNPNNYVGYLAFPVGQLGVQEVISLLQETGLSGYLFSGGESPSPTGYLSKPEVVLKDEEKPKTQSPPEMFPDIQDAGKQLAGMNYCYGRHLVESAYIVPDTPVPSQNTLNSQGGTAYAPVPKSDVEGLASPIKDYPEDVKPKMWMRYWIHKDSTLPVPGEFVGILCRPVAAPPHVWWFQESSPFLYAGNWVETLNLTSGVVTAVTLEAARTDGGIGNQYNVKIQGCEVIVDSTDFFEYAVGERVAVLKVSSTVFSIGNYNSSFTWLEQPLLKDTDKLTKKADYVIAPMTYFKVAH